MGVSNAIEIGSVGELGVSYQLALRGWSVFTPMVPDNGHKFDLLIHKKNKIHRIQVKTTNTLDKQRQNRYVLTASCSRKGSPNRKNIYTRDDCDYIIASVTPEEWYFVFPVERVSVIKISIPLHLPHGHFSTMHKDAWELLEV